MWIGFSFQCTVFYVLGFWCLKNISIFPAADSLGLTPADDGELAIRALGACVWYLKQSFLDQQLLSMKKFEVYTPVDSGEAPIDSEREDLGRHMVSVVLLRAQR